MHAHCIHGGCNKGAECYSLQALKLASLTYVQHILDRIAVKRVGGTPKHEYQASGEAVAAVATELAVVIAEMGMEFKLKCDVASGKAAEC